MHQDGTVGGQRRARTGLTVTAAVVGLALLGACGSVKPFMKPEWSRPDNSPNQVEGASNGQLTEEHLEQVTDTCRLEKEAVASLKEMVQDAADDGVTLVPGSCYRDLTGQRTVRSSWCSTGSCNMAAPPGTSKHGWGRAIDFRDQDGSLGFDSVGFAWMRWHGHMYGWNHPGWAHPTGSSPEAWHWEWVGDGGVLFPDGSDTPLPGTPDVPEIPAPDEAPPVGVDQRELPPPPAQPLPAPPVSELPPAPNPGPSTEVAPAPVQPSPPTPPATRPQPTAPAPTTPPSTAPRPAPTAPAPTAPAPPTSAATTVPDRSSSAPPATTRSATPEAATDG